MSIFIDPSAFYPEQVDDYQTYVIGIVAGAVRAAAGAAISILGPMIQQAFTGAGE